MFYPLAAKDYEATKTLLHNTKRETQSHRENTEDVAGMVDQLFERGLQDRQDTLRGRMGQDSRIFDLSAGWKHVVPSTKSLRIYFQLSLDGFLSMATT